MQFTYDAYKNLIILLMNKGYNFCDYHNWSDLDKCVILRHDIDTSINKAWEMAKIEADLGVTSTYFVLLKTDFYNVASKNNISKISEIVSMGHEVGLHFDELAYDDADKNLFGVPKLIKREADILSNILRCPITTVSMHRPSKETLEANYVIPDMINSYGNIFFKDFKYLSDSRMNWREPVEDIVNSEQYTKLHILTHAFWYGEEVKSVENIIARFVDDARLERYASLDNNIRDLKQLYKID